MCNQCWERYGVKSRAYLQIKFVHHIIISFISHFLINASLKLKDQPDLLFSWLKLYV